MHFCCFFLTIEPLYDDPMATNRSEPTWKSFTSGFGDKIARLSGKGKATKNGKKQSTEKVYKYVFFLH
jgi:hypothetical protein